MWRPALRLVFVLAGGIAFAVAVLLVECGGGLWPELCGHNLPLSFGALCILGWIVLAVVVRVWHLMRSSQ